MRAGEGWDRLTYADSLTRVRDVAGWILSTPAAADRPVMALSEDSIDLAGHDRDEVGFLLIPNEAACRAAAAIPADSPLVDVLAAPAVRSAIASGLARLRADGGGTSRFAARARFLVAPPNSDAGEITDKAYLNQRQILANRADDVAALFGTDPDAYIEPS